MAVPPQIQSLLQKLDSISDACAAASAQVRNGTADLRTRELDPKLDPTFTSAMYQEIRLRAGPFITTIRDTARALPDVT